MAKISIIVPVYNSERYVSETLDSLLGQTYTDIEMICVNDGSTDSSMRILNDYATKDHRVRTINQENKGVSEARNAAIAQANGDILMFVDADDALVPNACEKIAEIFAEQQPETLTFGLVCDPPEAAPATLRRELTPPSKIYEGFEPTLLFKDKARPYACRTALSRSFLVRESIRFEPGISLGEDQVFYFEVYPTSRKTVLIPDQLYIYRMNDASATHESTAGRERLLKKLDQHLMVIEAICRSWAKRGMQNFCSEDFLEWCLSFVMLDISKLLSSDQQRMYRRLMRALEELFDRSPYDIGKRLPSKRCLRDIHAAIEKPGNPATPVISSLNLGLFYLMYRGLAQCVERILMRLGIAS